MTMFAWTALSAGLFASSVSLVYARDMWLAFVILWWIALAVWTVIGCKMWMEWIVP